MASLNLKAIKKRYGKVEIIKGVDLEIKDGEFVVFVGPSGCGKSTLLRMIAGLEEISEGSLDIGGKIVNDLQPKERGIAMVFQSYALYPHKTVRDNMAFGLQLAKVPEQEIAAKVQNAARILQMEHLLDRRPNQLSGGQRQRVAIGRAIVRNPGVFLFDEPLSNLDAALRVNTRVEIAKLHHDLGATMIYVTHDQVEAMTLADKIVVLEAGYVRQAGSPMELYHTPQNLFVAGFIGSPKMNFLDGTISALTDKGVTVALKSGATVTVPVKAGNGKAGDAVKLGIRPEHIVGEGQATAAVTGTIEVVERLGAETIVNLATGQGEKMVATLDGSVLHRVGDTIKVAFDGVEAHLFNADGNAFEKIAIPALVSEFKKLRSA
jgi:multiple sugar transport system ATP-binding protein